jgi:phytanoyl-CoA dioxygenase PhyH
MMNAAWRLTATELQTYRTDGLLVPPFRIAEDLLVRMRDSLERLLAASPDIPPESLICPHIRSSSAHDEKAAAEWFEYATQPRILDLVEQLIGPDIILWGSQVFCKPPLVGREVPWHQDGRYWPIRPLATCSVWIALDDVDAENGCMRFIPGSHAAGSVYSHRVSDRPGIVLNQEVEPDAFNEGHARDDVLKAGQFSLHDVYLIHGSAPNRSPRRRAAFVIRYMPATSVFDRSTERQQSQAGVAFSLSRRPIWLLRGHDRTGKNDFTVGHGDDYRLAPRVSDDV